MASRPTASDADPDNLTRAGFTARTPIDIHNRRAAIERIGRLSDNIIGFGPFGIGLDGMLAWVPVLGEIYSLAAGALLLIEGLRARVPPIVLIQVTWIVLVRTGVDVGNIIPGVGIVSSLIVDLFRGHKWAASLLTKAIDETLYLDGPADSTSQAYLDALARIRQDREKRRIVFMG
jgi:hypothetical protein